MTNIYVGNLNSQTTQDICRLCFPDLGGARERRDGPLQRSITRFRSRRNETSERSANGHLGVERRRPAWSHTESKRSTP
jgi:hypothetical protein